MKTRELARWLWVMAATTMLPLEAAEWEKGKRFPPLSLPTIEGTETFSLNDFRGEKVMLHVFASW